MIATMPPIDPNRLDERTVFGDVIAGQIRRIADEHEQLAWKLRALAKDVEHIGQPRGLNTVTATGVTEDVLRELGRSSAQVNLAALVKAAADYERHVPATTNDSEGE